MEATFVPLQSLVGIAPKLNISSAAVAICVYSLTFAILYPLAKKSVSKTAIGGAVIGGALLSAMVFRLMHL